MRICVMGLWHLGTVTAACMASLGNEVVGFDFDEKTVSNLINGQPPIYEPGLAELVKEGLEKKTLVFTNDILEAFRNVEVVWVTYDTPVDEDDNADVNYVIERVKKIIRYLAPGTLVLISSQVPVGSIRLLEKAFPEFSGSISFAYSPENLRLGKAIDVFMHPDRIVVGIRSETDRLKIEKLLYPITQHIEWMSVESAEMTKHAINAFLATSVVFINEIASLCEVVGADAKEVERGLKSEARIGPKAYLGPGGAFAGGTLARDIKFLINSASQNNQSSFLFSAVKLSNDTHRRWPQRRLQELLGELKGKKIAVWGLTYKPGTNTLRRSSSVELCLWLHEQQAIVQAHDPAIKELPENLSFIQLGEFPDEPLKNASALVIATEWPDYREIDPRIFTSLMKDPFILDANGFIAKKINDFSKIKYFSVGRTYGNS